MKKILFILLITTTGNLFSQDTLMYFVTKDGKEALKENAIGYRRVMKTSEGFFRVLDYYMDGKLQMEATYLTGSLKEKTGSITFYEENGSFKSKSFYKQGNKNGKSIVYHHNGEIKSDVDYVQGKKQGLVVTYWEGGTLKRKDKYVNGNFVEGMCYDEYGELIEHFPFEVMPKFHGGNQEMFSFLAKNMRYPPKAKENNIQGKVYTHFTISKTGKIEQLEIIKAVHPILDNEALRVVRAMPDWTPAELDGEVVSVSYNLPLNFILNNTSSSSRHIKGLKHVEKSSSSSSSNREKGLEYFEKEDYEKSIYYYSKIIKVKKNDIDLLYHRGMAYHKSGKTKKAIKDLTKAKELGSKDAEMYLKMLK